MLTIRSSKLEDGPYLAVVLNDPDILRWFPMVNEREVEDAVRLWIGYSRMEACITAEWNGKPCGFAVLNIQPYKKLAHTCLLSIIVDERHRGKGVGTKLLEELEKRAKENFGIEILHLEVYEGNPAYRLYKRLGYEEYGKQTHFIKDNGKYLGKIYMQKRL